MIDKAIIDEAVTVLRDKTHLSRLAESEVRQALERLEEHGFILLKSGYPDPKPEVPYGYETNPQPKEANKSS